jgi:hypothetical protein
LENLGDDVDINRAWETIKENVIISAKDNRSSISHGLTKDVQNY